jgi:hypothetical protein
MKTGGGGGGSRDSLPMFAKTTREAVNKQWTRAMVSAGLPLSFFDDPEVRQAFVMTAQCGQDCISTLPGGRKASTIPHRQTFTKMLLPDLDKSLDEKNMKVMLAMCDELGGALFSDGWTATNHHPIINVILGVRHLYTLRAAIDTMGEEKTMDYVAELMVGHINALGPGRVIAVCMDGACKGAFAKIRALLPWVQCFVCVGHGMDGFLKNVGSSKEYVRMQVIT